MELKKVNKTYDDQSGLNRYWYCSPDMDLFVWADSRPTYLEFQLCYDKSNKEKCLIYKTDSGYEHSVLNVEEERPDRYTGSPTMMNGASNIENNLLDQFSRVSGLLEPELVNFIKLHLVKYLKL